MKIAFYFFSLLAVLAVLRVILNTKPVHALIYLVFSLIAITCIFFILGAYLAGALEIIIYAGAIVVMFIFVVMMLNINEKKNNKKFSWRLLYSWIGTLSISLILLIILIYISNTLSNDKISIVSKPITIKTIACLLFGPYALAIEMASMLLLAGIIVIFHLGNHESYSIETFYKVSKISSTLKKEGR